MTRGKGTLLLAGFFAACAASSRVEAQVNFPTVTRNYSATLVRAVDRCTPGALSVIGAGLPGSGCIAANSTTDDQQVFDFGKLVVKSKTGRISVLGRGMIPGSRVKILLTVRVTKNGVLTKHPPTTSSRVTFADQTLLCAQDPFGFVVSARGVLGGKTDLATCTAPNGGLATGNIEILDAALVNADNNNRVFARPGILR
jgi:hypothetical protein